MKIQPIVSSQTLRDNNDKSATFRNNIQGRGLVQVLSYFRDYGGKALFGEEKMNIPLFRDPSFVRELLEASHHCLLVSSADPKYIPEWIKELTHLKHITIPTHFRTSLNSKYQAFSAPLPLVYKEIDEEVRKATTAGTLVLVAGGIIGKIFIESARDAGGVALDVGSILDEWVDAGIHSLH